MQARAIPYRSPKEMTNISMEHYNGLQSSYGKKSGLRPARKHLAGYADVAIASGFQVAPSVRTALVTAEEPLTVIALLRSLYSCRNREAA